MNTTTTTTTTDADVVERFGQPCAVCGDSVGTTCSCQFWLEKVMIRNDPRVVRAAGRHYWIGREDEDTNTRFRGHAGRRFRVEFFDGRVVETTNLWYNGVVPERFEAQLPDNAELKEVR